MRGFMQAVIFGYILTLPFTVRSIAAEPQSTEIQRGAELFATRCVLCHGKDGRGEGQLPLVLKNYPNTNLTVVGKAIDSDSIRRVIAEGGGKAGISVEMPPWRDELQESDLGALTAFTQYLRADTEAAGDMLRRMVKEEKPSPALGKKVYVAYCSLCHGAEGRGDGKMRKVIKDPPPFNLTRSTLDDGGLMQIIAAGGQAVDRSARMPPWGAQLTGAELMSVITHLKSMRE